MTFQKLDIEDAKRCVVGCESGEVSVLDVRDEEEWSVGHAKGALHFDLARMQAGEFPSIPKEKEICVYCATGIRAEMAKEVLLKNGFKDVKNLGGLREWKLAGGDVVK